MSWLGDVAGNLAGDIVGSVLGDSAGDKFGKFTKKAVGFHEAISPGAKFNSKMIDSVMGQDNKQARMSTARNVEHQCCHHADTQPVDTPQTQQPTDFADMDGVDGNVVQNDDSSSKPEGKTIIVDQKYLDEHGGVVEGGDGNDTFIINGDLKDVKIVGGKGDDTVIVNGSLTDAKINLGEGNDTFVNNGKVSDAKINLGEGDDTATNNGKMDDVKLNAGDGDDTGINNGEITNSVLDGGAGKNTGTNNGTLTDSILKNWSSTADHNCDSDPETEQPAAPVAAQPEAPVVEEPATPVVEEPATPVTEQPATPVTEQPATPVTAQAETPDVEENDAVSPAIEEVVTSDVDEHDCPVEEPVVAIKDGARIWGDPHFVGADGGTYDVQGEAGKTYNLLSDEGIQVNGKFEARGEGVTVIGEAGVVLDGHEIKIGKDGSLEIDGEVIDCDGEHLDGKVIKEGNKVIIKDEEYDITFDQKGGSIDINFASENVNADGVMPHGLFGQSADGDGEARNGDKGSGAQGGGAIDNMFDNRTEAGDKTTVGQYEVEDLFDADFTEFNRYG